MEVWKDVVGYEGLYQVSNYGRLKRVFKNKKEHLLTGKKDKDGYIQVILSRNQKKKHCRLHRLVAETFIPNPNDKPVVNHKDKNVLNNTVDNLEWATVSENTKHGYETGRSVHGRSVIQYTKNMEYVACWKSIEKAARVLGVDQANICACCNGRQKTSGGYIWRYKEAE